jgi:hypothetical protein
MRADVFSVSGMSQDTFLAWPARGDTGRVVSDRCRSR